MEGVFEQDTFSAMQPGRLIERCDAGATYETKLRKQQQMMEDDGETLVPLLLRVDSQN
jgi:hypothetical protein